MTAMHTLDALAQIAGAVLVFLGLAGFAQHGLAVLRALRNRN